MQKLHSFEQKLREQFKTENFEIIEYSISMGRYIMIYLLNNRHIGTYHPESEQGTIFTDNSRRTTHHM